MIRSFLINKYLGKEFIKIVINTSIIFFCLGFIMNIFEEINFFKDFDVGLYIPITLSLLYVPSLFYNMFPFIILLSGIWFFLKIRKTDEATAINVSGMSNFSIILIPSILVILLGIFFITSINPITSVLVTKYETIKGNYERDKEYLAAITENGIWIKEKNLDKNNIIKSSYLENENLINVTIYEFDNNNEFVRRIEAESANISSLKWSLKNVKIINPDGVVTSKNIKNISHISLYDIQKIKSLYSNLDTISFWSLENEIKLLKERGYGDILRMWAYSRVDTIRDPENLKLLKEAGIKWLGIGIESADPQVRLEVTKGKFENIDIREVIKKVHDAGLGVIANYLFGLTGDNMESMQKTLELGLELNTIAWNGYAVMALPGSRVYKDAIKAGHELPSDYIGYSFHGYETVPLPTETLSPKDVLKFRDQAFITYHSYPPFIKKIKQRFGEVPVDNIQEMLKQNT